MGAHGNRHASCAIRALRTHKGASAVEKAIIGQPILLQIAEC